MIGRKPLTRSARLVAIVLAVVCLVASGSAGVLAIRRQHAGLALAAVAGLAIGVLYVAAAWRGRPWP